MWNGMYWGNTVNVSSLMSITAVWHPHLVNSFKFKFTHLKIFNSTSFSSKPSSMYAQMCYNMSNMYHIKHNTTHLHSAFSLSGSVESTKPFVHLGHNIVLAWVSNSLLLLHLSHVHQKNFASCRCDRLFNVPCCGWENEMAWNIIF